MIIDFYKDNKKIFANAVLDILRQTEVQNNVLIKIAMGFKNGEDKEDWYCATVKDDNGGIITTAMCTPPYNMVIYETGNKHDSEALDFLAREIYNAGYNPPGIVGEAVTAEMFAERYARVSGKNMRIYMTMNAMQLFEVSKIDYVTGFMREITEEDLYYAPYWEKSFQVECSVDLHITLENKIEAVKNRMGKSKHYIWFDKTPVSQAVFARDNFNGAAVSYVYTPPFYRGKGYSTSLMAQLSQNLLDRGYQYCCLFADADYHAIKIYQKVGYKNVCLYREIRFEDKSGIKQNENRIV